MKTFGYALSFTTSIQHSTVIHSVGNTLIHADLPAFSHQVNSFIHWVVGALLALSMKTEEREERKRSRGDEHRFAKDLSWTKTLPVFSNSSSVFRRKYLHPYFIKEKTEPRVTRSPAQGHIADDTQV